jgi:hypothetical protein
VSQLGTDSVFFFRVRTFQQISCSALWFFPMDLFVFLWVVLSLSPQKFRFSPKVSARGQISSFTGIWLRPVFKFAADLVLLFIASSFIWGDFCIR